MLYTPGHPFVVTLYVCRKKYLTIKYTEGCRKAILIVSVLSVIGNKFYLRSTIVTSSIEKCFKVFFMRLIIIHNEVY